MVASTTSRQLLRAKGLVDSRYAEDLRVEDMARAASLSRAHFSERFKSAFGISPERALVPECVKRFYGRPQHRTFREDPSGSQA